MSSPMLLNVKTHLTEFRSNSDTLSEASDSGTSVSVTSAEELQKFALILGLNSVEDVFQDRFRIDRRRLEGMLADTLEESQTAQVFFHRVMTDTNTLIKWPTRLKVGARSKKDPHVRVIGRMENVKLAREKIMQLLDTKSNRITMKIDVSYTDHSHIIGKGGLTIKRVMEETGCHIHFPDSNRTSTVEKSNQVSIAGDMERVERARAKVRALTPLVFSFELPITASSQSPDINTPFIQQIQDKYNVQVMLRNRPKLHANLLVVKGAQWDVQATMDATTHIMNYMCGSLANQTQVLMSLEISPMHHSVVVGRGAEQLKIIMRGTNTQIMFPDAEDPNIPLIKRSCVTISGLIKDVYAARQQLLGSLPLVVIFDVSEDACRCDTEFATRLMQKHNVYINIRRKPKQGIAAIVIKGIERCAADIYEARRELLGGNEPIIIADIPESYNIPAIQNSMPNFTSFNPFSPTHPANLPSLSISPNVASPYNLPTLPEFNYNSPMYNPPTPGGYPTALSPVALTPPVYNTWLIPSPQPRNSPFHYPSLAVPNHGVYGGNQPSWNPMNGGAEMGAMQPPMMMQTPYQHQHQNQHPSNDGRPMQTLNQLLNTSSAASSGYQSNFTGSCVSLDTQNYSGGDPNMVSPSVSPISKSHSPTPSSSCNDTDRSQTEIASIISELGMSDRRAVGCEKKTLETLNKLSPLSEYRKFKAEAHKAMQENVGSGYRVPTPKWSGYYFSHTSPGPINLNDQSDISAPTPEKKWKPSELTRPNIVETATADASPSTSTAYPSTSTTYPSTSTATISKVCRYKQLQDLLDDMSLSKYIDLFRQHEVDMSTFASLSEADLTELGVAAFGARRKMMLIINELKKQSSGYKRSGNTGPENKLVTSPKYNTDAISDKDKW